MLGCGIARATRGRLPPLSQSTGGFARDSVFITVAAWGRWKVAVHLHGSELDRLYFEQAGAVQWYMRKTLRRVDSIAVLGSSLRRVVGDFFPEDRIAVIPNGTPAPGAEVSAHDRRLGVFSRQLLAAQRSDRSSDCGGDGRRA